MKIVLAVEFLASQKWFFTDSFSGGEFLITLKK